MSRFFLFIASAVCLLVFFTETARARPGSDDKANAKRLEENFVKTKLQQPPGGARFRSLFQMPSSREAHDVVVLMDGSGSVGYCQFQKAKKALRYLLAVKNIYVDLKYSAVTFADSATVNFNFLADYFAANEMNRITYPGGGTNTHAALVKAMQLFEDRLAGGRSDVDKRIVFLVTDGSSNSPSETKAKAKELRERGVEIYVVAVGRYFSGIEEILKVASSPPEKYFYVASDLWDVVKQIVKDIAPDLLNGMNAATDLPC